MWSENCKPLALQSLLQTELSLSEKIETLLTLAHFYVVDDTSTPYIEQLDSLLRDHPELIVEQAHLMFLKGCKRQLVSDWPGSTQYLEKALKIYQEQGEVRGEVEVLLCIVVMRAISVRYGDGIVILEQCRELIEQHALPQICTMYMLTQFTLMHIVVGLYDLAESYGRRAYACAKSLNLHNEGVISKNVIRARVSATWTLSYALLLLEQFDESIELVEICLLLIKPLGVHYWEVRLLRMIANALIRRGDHTVAIERLTAVLGDTPAVMPHIHTHCYALLGIAYAEEGRDKEAEPLLLEVVRRYAVYAESKLIYLSCLNALAHIMKRKGQYEEAFAYLEQREQVSVEHEQKKSDMKLAHLTEIHKYDLKKQEAEMLRTSNEKLTKANHLLQQAYDEQSDLVKIVSHDIFSPLSSIILGTEMTKRYMQAERLDKAMNSLNTIRQSADYINVIVDQLITVDKLDQGEMKIEWQTMSLRRMIFSAVERNRPVAAEKQIEVTFNCQRRLSVHVDEVAMMQVLDNILSNGIKYSYPNSVIQINATQREDVVEILFTDQGVGIDHTEIHKLFSKFGRLDRSRPTSNERSTGLGLYIVKKFVHAMNGDVVACSDGLGTGTTFMIQLPSPRSTPVYQSSVPVVT